MSNTGRKDVDELIEQGRLTCENAQNSPEISTQLQPYGGAGLLETGKNLLQELIMNQDKQVHLNAEKKKATASFNQARAALNKTFALHRKVSRALLIDQPTLMTQLGLNGDIPSGYESWINLYRRFYQEPLNDATLSGLLEKVGLTREILQQSLLKSDEIVSVVAKQEAIKAQSQQATQDRDQAAKVFRKWRNDFLKIAEVALANNPQLLEQLGKIVK